MSDAIALRKMILVFNGSDNPGKETEEYTSLIESGTFVDIQVERQDIVSIDWGESEDEPETMWVTTKDDRKFFYTLDEDNDPEEQEYLLSLFPDEQFPYQH